MKKFICLVMTFVMLLSMMVTAGAQTSATFTDVPKDFWGYEAIDWCRKNGIMNGYGDGSFGPNDLVSCAQLCAVITRYFGEELKYPDECVRWCEQEEFVGQDAELFGGEYSEILVTKAYALDVLSKCLDGSEPELYEVSFGPYETISCECMFTETESVGTWTTENFYEDVLHLYRCGILAGNMDEFQQTVKANHCITRAELATIMARMKGYYLADNSAYVVQNVSDTDTISEIESFSEFTENQPDLEGVAQDKENHQPYLEDIDQEESSEEPTKSDETELSIANVDLLQLLDESWSCVSLSDDESERWRTFFRNCIETSVLRTPTTTELYAVQVAAEKSGFQYERKNVIGIGEGGGQAAVAGYLKGEKVVEYIDLQGGIDYNFIGMSKVQ